jgi:hypothetical protein
MPKRGALQRKLICRLFSPFVEGVRRGSCDATCGEGIRADGIRADGICADSRPLLTAAGGGTIVEYQFLDRHCSDSILEETG